MKVRKVPVASLILLILPITSFILCRINGTKFSYDSPFLIGAFFGAAVVYLLYYVNIWLGAWNNNRKEGIKDNTVI